MRPLPAMSRSEHSARRTALATKKFNLPESEIPEQWYNIAADLTSPPPPPLHPGTHQPIGPEALAPLFPMELIKQEVRKTIASILSRVLKKT